MARIAAMPCLVCGAQSTVHHVTASIHGGRLSRSNFRVVPLCPAHHQIQHGPRESVEALGHSGFWVFHGIDLLAEAERLAE
ncbi:MAG: HNH endonuclease [Pseudomonadota bacterium]